jgi:formylmethanofuran dehydrogenase subunit E
MSEENKEVKSDGNRAEKPVEPPKVEAPKVESPKVEAPKTEPPKTEEPKKDAALKPEEKKKERPVNCSVCNKSIKKTRYYYRNGKYFCTKRCFKTTVKKEGAAGEEKAA